MSEPIKGENHVVVIGGGFCGLYAVKSLRKSGVKITLIDKRNFHLFQPLLYQVATGELSPGDIASPLRYVFSGNNEIDIINDEVTDIDPDKQEIALKKGLVGYDYLIVATGVDKNYFGNESWQENAPGLKTIEDALAIRNKILYAFEAAEIEKNQAVRKAWLTFVVIGGGPTGVELSGAIAELAFKTLRREYHRIDPEEIEIILLEAAPRILSAYPDTLALKAGKSLNRLGVTVMTNSMVTDVSESDITISRNGEKITKHSKNIIWTAGIKGTKIADILSAKTGADLDRAGRVMVNRDFSVATCSNIFVAGDLANYSHQTGQPLPGIAPVAMQEGRFLARIIKARIKGKKIPVFRYRNKGMLAVIGRNAAIADFGVLRVSGFFAWLVWIFVHIMYLVEFDNKMIVMIQWAWNYFTHKRGTRIITSG